MTGKRDWSEVGGHPVVDLANTVVWRLDPNREADRLGEYADVVDWCCAKGVLTADEGDELIAEAAAHPRRGAAALREFRALRDQLYEALLHSDQAAIRAVVDAYRLWLNGVRLIPAGDGWHWRPETLDLDSPRQRVAELAVALLTGPGVGRLRQCRDAHCGWLFLDLSPRRNRQWCDPADCGNRNRVRAHYQRTRGRSS